MKDVEEHKFIWIWRRDLSFLPNANAFRKQGGEIFADWEALSRREAWMEKSAANMAKGIYNKDYV